MPSCRHVPSSTYQVTALAPLGFAIAAAYFVYAYRNVQTDDAYIFYTYARNIVRGDGYVFNPGEHVLATTSPLYTLGLALAYAILKVHPRLTIPMIAHVIGGFSLWSVAVITYRTFRWDGLRITALLFPVLLFACPLLEDAIGMETLVTISLVVGTISLYCRDAKLTPVLGALAVLSRPDSLLLIAALIVHYGITRHRLPPLRAWIAFIATLLPWLLFSALYFGTVVPSTLGAKLAQTASGRWGEGWIYWEGFVDRFFGGTWTYVPLAAFAVVGALRIAWRRSLAALLILTWSIAYLGAYTWLNPPAYGWYYTPLAVGLALSCALLGQEIHDLLQRCWPGLRTSLFVTVVLVPIAVWAVSTYQGAAERPITAKFESYVGAARWLNQNAHPGATIAANEVGILRYYYTAGLVIDGLALVTIDTGNNVARRNYAWYVHRYHPDFLVFSYPARPMLEEMVERQWFQRRYLLIKVIQTRRLPLAIYRARDGNPLVRQGPRTTTGERPIAWPRRGRPT